MLTIHALFENLAVARGVLPVGLNLVEMIGKVAGAQTKVRSNEKLIVANPIRLDYRLDKTILITQVARRNSMLSTEEVNAFGNITNTTWGKASTTTVPTISLKCTLVGDSGMTIAYQSVVVFASDQAMSQQIPKMENEAIQATDAYLKEIKRKFREETGRRLKVKVKSTQPSVEIVNLQPHISPKRTALYRHVTVFEID